MNGLFFTYVPGTSMIHTLDPRTKLIGMMLASICIFRSQSFVEMAVIALVLFILYLLSAVPFKEIIDSVRPLFFFLLFIFFVQLLFTDGTVLVSFYGVKVSDEGLVVGTLVMLKFVSLLIFALLLTATTTPSRITSGIERMLRPLPLKLLGISSFDIAAMMSLSLYFVPLLYDNFRQLKEAQLSRGLDTKYSPLRAVYSLSVPMIHASFRSAEEVAMAMESRCYQGVHRTSMFELKMKGRDYLSLLMLALFVLAFLRL